MPVPLKVPNVGESITEVEIGEWLKKNGDFAAENDPVVVIETEKATLDLPAPISGKVTEVLKKTGEKAAGGEVIGYMEEAAAPEQPSHGLALLRRGVRRGVMDDWSEWVLGPGTPRT